MSILIKGMEMPKSGCVITIYKICGNFYASKNGTEFCPLVEIPPHGRLMDADALKTLETKDYDGVWEVVVYKTDIDAAPTIIEAEASNELCNM